MMRCSDTWDPMGNLFFNCLSIFLTSSWSDSDVKPSAPTHTHTHTHTTHYHRTCYSFITEFRTRARIKNCAAKKKRKRVGDSGEERGREWGIVRKKEEESGG